MRGFRKGISIGTNVLYPLLRTKAIYQKERIMRRKLGNIISVVYSFVKLSIMKLFYLGRLRFHPIERLSPNVVIDIGARSKIVLGKMVRAHSGTRFSVSNGGELIIGNNVRINNNCRIACRKSIQIGDGSEFGPGVLIYDHDHDFRAEGGIESNKFVEAPVVIGKNVWIGANTIILRGTVIGDNCVIGAGCVIKGEFKAGTLIIQKRETTETNIIEV